MTPISSRLDVPPWWREAADTLLALSCPRVLVVGAPDTGKSSFCRYLALRFRDRGTFPLLLDGDIGQKDLGPPATLTLGPWEGDRWTSRLQDLHFIGAVSPPGHLLPIVVGMGLLAERGREHPLVINTPGLIQGPGRPLLHSLMELLRPDGIVLLGRKRETEGLLSACFPFRTLRLRPSHAARRKSPIQRREARKQAFQAYFTGAKSKRLSLDHLAIQRSLLFNGRPADPEGGLYAEDTGEGKIVVTSGPVFRKGIKTVPPGFERGLLCGVIDSAGWCIGLARLEQIDFTDRILTLWSPVPQASIAGLQLGDLYLGAESEERDRRRPRNL